MKALLTTLAAKSSDFAVWEKDILTLVDECRANQVPCITSATREVLIDYINQYKPRTYLEIGSARWVSLFTAHQQIVQRWGTVTGIERSLPNVERVQQMIQDHQLTDIAIHHINANHPWWEQAIITKPIDFALIDARKSKYHIYLQTILPYMAQNSIIICDDVIEFEHKLSSLYEFLDQNQMNYEKLELSDGDWVIVIKLP